MQRTVDVLYITNYDNNDTYDALSSEILEMVNMTDKFIKHPRSSCRNFMVQFPNDGKWLGIISDKHNRKLLRFRVIRSKSSKEVLEHDLDAILETQDQKEYDIAHGHLGFSEDSDFGPQSCTIIIPCLSADRADTLVDAVARFYSKRNPYAVLDLTTYEDWNLCRSAERLQCEYLLKNNQIDSDYLALSRKFLSNKRRCVGGLLGGYLNIAAVLFGG